MFAIVVVVATTTVILWCCHHRHPALSLSSVSLPPCAPLWCRCSCHRRCHCMGVAVCRRYLSPRLPLCTLSSVAAISLSLSLSLRVCVSVVVAIVASTAATLCACCRLRRRHCCDLVVIVPSVPPLSAALAVTVTTHTQ